MSRTFASLCLALVVAFVSFTPAAAQAPANDDFDAATAITALPYSDSGNVSEATIAPDDPIQSCHDLSTPSVWYSFTPTANKRIDANTFGNDYGTVLAVYTGSRGDLTEIACNDDTYSAGQWGSRVIFDAVGGTTYYFLITSLYETGGDLSFSVQEVVPPPNDDIGAAKVISELPYTDSIDTTGAIEAIDDPILSCRDRSTASVWYSFTPTVDMSVAADISASDYNLTIAVFTASPGALTEFACGIPVLNLKGGTTYYFLIVNDFGEGGGNLIFSLHEPQPLEPDFWFYPNDPSIFNTIEFCDGTYDPEGAWPLLTNWDFDDGTSSTDNCAYHQYSMDGDYNVVLTAQTDDGRSASISKVVQVRTHDVAITKIAAPVAAKTGQTRSIKIYVRSLRYDETVAVELYKSIPGGEDWIGSSIQFVPVRSTRRTTAFTFKYTFTQADADVGTVTFRATAYIMGASDALSADNEAISSPPTKVAR